MCHVRIRIKCWEGDQAGGSVVKVLPVQAEEPRLGFPDPNECQVGMAACLLFLLQKTDSEFPQSIQRDEPHQQPLGLIKRPCLNATG